MDKIIVVLFIAQVFTNKSGNNSFGTVIKISLCKSENCEQYDLTLTFY